MRATAYGALDNGTAIERYVLSRSAALSVGVLTYGGIIDTVEVPGADGSSVNVVLGFPELAGYEHASGVYFGAAIGRYANRIANGTFELDGARYDLSRNDGPNTLHGGTNGFDRAVWRVAEASATRLVLEHESPDGDQGFPGRLHARVTYAISADDPGTLQIDYAATADAPTVVNLTNHSYFNLGGDGAGSVEAHLVRLAAARYTPVDEHLIPTGERADVSGTPFDFRTPRAIGDALAQPHPQLLRAHGYDHNFVLYAGSGKPVFAAEVTDPRSGRRLRVETSEPGLQFYSGNFLSGEYAGHAGRAYRQTNGFALETQHFPNSPNEPSFPTTVLRPGQEFSSTTLYRFSAAGSTNA